MQKWQNNTLPALVAYRWPNMKKILTDADGVLFDWESSFHRWMTVKGHKKIKHGLYNLAEVYGILTEEKLNLVREYNESAWICCLPALRDSIEGVSKLSRAGYRFDVITSLSTDLYAKQLRQQNLELHFGKEPWNELICLDTGADKDDALAAYKDSGLWWIEDKPENCEAGLRAGLRPILIDHSYNQDYQNNAVPRVKTWQEICELILND